MLLICATNRLVKTGHWCVVGMNQSMVAISSWIDLRWSKKGSQTLQNLEEVPRKEYLIFSSVIKWRASLSHWEWEGGWGFFQCSKITRLAKSERKATRQCGNSLHFAIQHVGLLRSWHSEYVLDCLSHFRCYAREERGLVPYVDIRSKCYLSIGMY